MQVRVYTSYLYSVNSEKCGMAEQNNIVINESSLYSDLVLLAMTLVFKDVSQVSLKQAEVINLLHAAATELGNNPDLKINAFKGDEQPVEPPLQRATKSTTTLLDLFAEHAAEYNYRQSFISFEQNKSTNESIQEILDNLIDSENENHIHLYKSNALSNAIESFLRNLLKASGIVIKDIKDLIENAKKQQHSFIIPDCLRFPPQIQAALKAS